jgi:hypothetical protein
MKIDWRLVVAVTALIVAILGFFGGSWWRTSDVVFDDRAVRIPLSDSLKTYIEQALASAHPHSGTFKHNKDQIAFSPLLNIKTIPDRLVYVNIRNVGHVPSATVKVRIAVPGQTADKSITDAGPAYGTVSDVRESDSTGELSFEVRNLSNHPDARIKVAIWYSGNGTNVGIHPDRPIVEIQDTSAGMSREVGSVEVASFYWWDFITPLRVALFVLIGLFMLAVGVFYVTRPGGDLMWRAEARQAQQAENRNEGSAAK